jgi:hypothetical protein
MMSDEEQTSSLEWALLTILLVAGFVFFTEPGVPTTGAFVDFVDSFPEAGSLGPNGSLVAMVALLLGGGGLVRKKL